MTVTTHDEELSTIVADQAQRLFDGLVTRDVLGAADAGEWQAALWAGVTDAGLPLALVREEQGGIGLAPRDAFGLLRLAARAAAPVPLGETMVARALWCAAGGGVDDAGAGASPVTLVPQDGAGVFRIEPDGDAFVLSGRAASVPWLQAADACLVHAQDRSGRGFLVLLPRTAADEACRVATGDAPVASRNLAHEPHGALACERLVVNAGAVREVHGWLAREGLQAHGALLRAQQMVGAMERCLSSALQYANERVQFGRAISKFPAVQDLLVESACQTAAAASAVSRAVRSWNAGAQADDDAAFVILAGMAKARAGEAAGIVAAACHQVHGAIGFTQEHLLHHSTRRLWAWRDEFGSESHWQEAIGRDVCARGGARLWPWLTALQDGTQAVR